MSPSISPSLNDVSSQLFGFQPLTMVICTFFPKKWSAIQSNTKYIFHIDFLRMKIIFVDIDWIYETDVIYLINHIHTYVFVTSYFLFGYFRYGIVFAILFAFWICERVWINRTSCNKSVCDCSLCLWVTYEKNEKVNDKTKCGPPDQEIISIFYLF